MLLKSKIPDVYHKILSDFLEIQVPDEKIATCSNCNLCQTDKSPYLDVKCCNYFPILSNYLVGGILSDPEENLTVGKNKLIELIKNKKGVTPYGIFPDKVYVSTQKNILKQGKLFHSKDDYSLQQCPYLDHGNCSVWKYRENLCVTFFCSSIGGSQGDFFWKKLNELIKLSERKLAHYVMLKLGWKPENISLESFSTKMFVFENENGEINESGYAKLWGDWFGKENQFYEKTYELIKEIDKKTFGKIMGLDLEIFNKSISNLATRFNQNTYPSILILNPDLEVNLTPKGNCFLTLKGNEIEIESVYFPFLKMFNGKRTTIEVFHHAYKLLLSLNQVVDELIQKDMLLKVA